MAALKHAIIVRGPNGVGKSRVVYTIRDRRLSMGHACGVATLDHGWSHGEFRRLENDPPERRYGDLVGRHETLLLVEIGLGDPDDARDYEHLGATRNPREWVELLSNDGRQLTLIRLEADQRIIEERLRERHEREKRPGPATDQELQHIRRIQNDDWAPLHGPINLPLRAGLHEDVVRTDSGNWDAIADDVLGRMKHPLHG